MPPEKPVAVVTGAARSIGCRVALTLAGHGYAVVTNDLEAQGGTLDEPRSISDLSVLMRY